MFGHVECYMQIEIAFLLWLLAKKNMFKFAYRNVFRANSLQGTNNEGNNYVVCVIPEGSTTKSGCFNKLNSLSKVKDTDLICAVLTGKLDRSILILPCGKYFSSFR